MPKNVIGIVPSSTVPSSSGLNRAPPANEIVGGRDAVGICVDTCHFFAFLCGKSGRIWFKLVLDNVIIEGLSLFPLTVYSDHRGSLVPFEIGTNLPFPMRRFFCINVVEPGITRAEHCSSAEELLVVLCGAVECDADNGAATASVQLQAITALADLGEKARSVIDDIRKATKGTEYVARVSQRALKKLEPQ